MDVLPSQGCQAPPEVYKNLGACTESENREKWRFSFLVTAKLQGNLLQKNSVVRQQINFSIQTILLLHEAYLGNWYGWINPNRIFYTCMEPESNRKINIYYISERDS
jgi:hypothetical protein